MPHVEPTLSVVPGASPEIASRLSAEIAARFGPRDEAPLSVLAHANDGTLVGGLNGVIHWRWLYVRHLWVEETARGNGIGRRLLGAAETEAATRACVGMYVDTFDPVVAAYYERAGFTRAGEIVDFPPGGRRIYLGKRLR